MNQRTFTSLAAFAAAMALVPAAAQAAEIETALVSRASGFDGVPSGAFSGDPSVSADGRFVAFSSQANGLSDADDDNVLNVFVRDRATGTTELISKGAGVPANGDAAAPQITPDGRYVAYLSEASNISAADDNIAQDAYVYDRVTGTTTYASRADGINGAASVQGAASLSISDDGTKVAFSSQSDNLSNLDDNTAGNVYVRDLVAGTTELVSMDGAQGGDDDSGEPAISGDGTDVAFTSDATNLAGGGAPNFADVYVRNLVNDTTTLVSRPTGFNAVVGDGHSKAPAISHSGRFVAFQTGADNLVDTDNDAVNWKVLRRDTFLGQTVLVSRATGANGTPNNNQASTPEISANGAIVAFDSFAQLDPAAVPGVNNVYTRDIAGSTTTLMSRATGPDGEGVDVNTFGHALSADGQTVAFATSANNVTPEDLGGIADVFVRGLSIDPIVPPQGGGGGGGGGQAEEPVVEQPQPQPEQPVGGGEITVPVDTSAGSALAPKLRMKLMRLTGTKAKVRVTCVAGDCRGTLRLQRVKGQGSKRLGRAAFAVPAGAEQTVTVRLKRSAAKPKVRATAVVKPAGAAKTVVAKTLRLKRA
ncbi:MAG TPA: hypothetical protein VIL49_10105 [Capillimicrobium sp.]|jgi:Tol biopolymer transport system component